MDIEPFVAQFRSPNTADAYRRNIRRFVEWLGEDRLVELEAGDLGNFVAFLSEEGYAPASVNQQLSAVKSFLKWATRQKLVSASVYAEALTVEGVKKDQRLPRPLKSHEVTALLAQPDLENLAGARDYAYIQFSLSTGCRVSEAVSIDIETVDWDAREVVILGKGRVERKLLFSKAAAAALVYYLGLRGNSTSGPLFTNEDGERISARYFQKVVRRYGEAAGIEGLYPHIFRHTLATNLLEHSGDLDAVSKVLGHSDPSTTRVYTRLATGRLRRLLDGLHDGDEPIGELARVPTPVRLKELQATK